MRTQQTAIDPAKLHRWGYILIWVQALLGGVLLAQTWPPLTHILFACLSAAVLLCMRAANKSRGARVTARILVGLYWLVAAMFATQAVLTVLSGWAYYAPDLLDGLCWFFGLFLCYTTPAAATVMLYNGVHTASYDRITACLSQTCVAPVAALCIFSDTAIPWVADGKVLPYLWLVLTIVTTLVLWLCAKIRTPAQEKALALRREKRAARKKRSKV